LKALPITGSARRYILRDPDDNGVELYCDRPREQWPRTADGDLAMFTRPLDLAALLAVREPPAESAAESVGQIEG